MLLLFYVLERRTNKKGGGELPNKLAQDKKTEQAMKMLGKKLAKCRGERSLRQVSKLSGIVPSQLLSIENGTLAPTSDAYASLLSVFALSERQKTELDRLFMAIRKVPPPDVCKVIINCPDLISVLRTVDGVTLTKQQINSINSLLASFAQENTKGDAENG